MFNKDNNNNGKRNYYTDFFNRFKKDHKDLPDLPEFLKTNQHYLEAKTGNIKSIFILTELYESRSDKINIISGLLSIPVSHAIHIVDYMIKLSMQDERIFTNLKDTHSYVRVLEYYENSFDDNGVFITQTVSTRRGIPFSLMQEMFQVIDAKVDLEKETEILITDDMYGIVTELVENYKVKTNSVLKELVLRYEGEPNLSITLLRDNKKLIYIVIKDPSISQTTGL